MTRPAGFDLRAALRDRTPQQIADLLERVPVLAEALEGRGTLSGLGRYGLSYPMPRAAAGPTLERLAALLGSAAGIDVSLAALDRFALQLVTLAVWHGGALDRATALAEAGADRADDLARAVADLDALLLIDPAAGWLVLRPGVAAVVGLPGVPVRAHAHAMNSDAVAGMLRRFGIDRPPPRKMQRVAELEACLRDPQAISTAAAGLSAEALRVFNLLLAQGPQRVVDVGVPYYMAWHRGDTPLHELETCGLIGVDAGDQVAWVWLDVLVGLEGGRLFAEWPAPAAAAPARPLRENPGLPPVLGRLPALLEQWRAEPAPALQTGGLGVRPIRAAAKALGMPAGEVGLLAAVAVSLGLLGQVSLGVKGRGRMRTETWVWSPTSLAAEFAALPAERRWALLVQTWRDAKNFDETQGLPERVEEDLGPGGSLARSALLRLLRDLPAGTGLALEDLTLHAETHTSGNLRGPAVGFVVEGARALGLVPAQGPVGLTTLARALLEGPEALAAALPPPRAEFTVQADLSVVAPPDLAPDIAGQLERYAELESAAGARLYRLSERRIGAALDAGDTASDILDFLGEHTTAALAQNVEYLVRDCERRHGRLRAGACVSYLRSEDPAALSGALAVKAAKLRLLAPTVAVSSLPRAKVVAALRAKGLMPVAEDADGVTLAPAAATATPTARAGGGLPALRDALEIRRADAEALAQKVLAADELVPDAPSPVGQPASRYVPDERWPDVQMVLDADTYDDDDDDDGVDDEWDVDEIVAATLAEQRAVLQRLLETAESPPPNRNRRWEA